MAIADRSKLLTEDRVLGRFAGFDLLAEPMSNGKAQLCLKGSTRHTITVQRTAHGTNRSLEHQVQKLEETALQTHDHLIESRKRLVDLSDQVDQTFEYATRLAVLAAKQQELVEKLDLNQNAARPVGRKHFAVPVPAKHEPTDNLFLPTASKMMRFNRLHHKRRNSSMDILRV